MGSVALIAALERIASAASEALDLKEVFGAVAEAVAAILPFDRISVMQFGGRDTLRMHSFAGSVPAPNPQAAVSLHDLSPGIRPSLLCARRIEDLGPILSPEHAAAGHGASEDVTALEGGGDGLELDRRRAREAELAHAAEQVRVKAEGGEGHGIVAF